MTGRLRPTLPEVDAEHLATYANPNDLRRDLHTFVAYVQDRVIKRTYRENDLPQADVKRLTQLIRNDTGLSSDLYSAANYYYRRDGGDWLGFVDRLAHTLGFVTYLAPEAHRSLYQPTALYSDNFMRFQPEQYNRFLEQPVAEQEHSLLQTLLSAYSYTYNEFFVTSILGRLDRFNSAAYATGVLPAVHFDEARALILDLLSACTPGIWHHTADLIAFMKEHYPYFLIPQQPVRYLPETGKRRQFSNPRTQVPLKRYGNFIEGTTYPPGYVPEDAPDGFERVEGRFIERFLEGIPLTLGYIEVAYAAEPSSSVKPSRGLLKAFRVTERFRQATQGEFPQPRVIVQPNFEVLIESAFFPASLLRTVTPLADVVRADTTTVLRLQRQKVAAHLSTHPDADPIALLTALSGRDLPQNVAVELKEWAGRATVFTLYDGFGVVESSGQHPAVDAYSVETLGPTLRLVRNPNDLYSALIASGTVVQKIAHGASAWTLLPVGLQTLFPQAEAPERAPKKRPARDAVIKRSALIELQFGDDELFQTFRTALLDARCLVHIDRERCALTVARKDEAHVKEIIKQLRGQYNVRFEDAQ